jgi:Immunity protein 35/Papain fold toxin 1, glutamine deamidase
MTDPAQQADDWLHHRYQGMVELAAPVPVSEGPQAWVFGCRARQVPGYPRTPMLTSLVAVPKNGTEPFHPATDDPWGDLAAFDRDPGPRDSAAQARRLNARGCVLAADAAIRGARATPLAWQPFHEAPGWWNRMIRRYFSAAEVSTCASWEEVMAAMDQPVSDTCGVVWIRRELNGAEATGHLIYAQKKDDRLVFLDPQAGHLARLESTGIRQLTLARFPGVDMGGPSVKPPWCRPAPDLPSAIAKAEQWLLDAYRGEVALVSPTPADELSRGWLFATNTKAFLSGGKPADAMLDTALVVPQDDGSPFGLPNSDPWGWLARWDDGTEPGTEGLELPPKPGPSAWMPSTMGRLGSIISITDHASWQTVVAEMATSPEGARAVVWVRRDDRQGRESVGLLIVAAHTPRGLIFIDAARDEPAELASEGVRSLHLIRYR